MSLEGSGALKSVNGSQEVKVHQSYGWGHGRCSIHLSGFEPVCVCVCVLVYVNIVVVGEGARVFVCRLNMSGSARLWMAARVR